MAYRERCDVIEAGRPDAGRVAPLHRRLLVPLALKEHKDGRPMNGTEMSQDRAKKES
jgi:hypothetical protein